MKTKPQFFEIRYIVRGSGTFPFDMLHYDTACPATEEDSHIAKRDGPRTVRLRRFAKEPRAAPQIARWRSFRWTVVEIIYADETVEQLSDTFSTETRIVGNKLLCSYCKKLSTPHLVELGMIVNHTLVELGEKKIRAVGWNGDSEQVSQEGEMIALECTECFGTHALPRGIEVDWDEEESKR